mgnify:CR=1 FL=1
MSGFRGTPGPWQFVEIGHPTDGVGYIRPIDEDGREIAHHGDMARSREENLANAHLISVAPELLDECGKAAESMSRMGDCLAMDSLTRECVDDQVSRILTLCAKAEGKLT